MQYNSSAIGASNRRYLHTDHQGSIIAHSDSSGNVFATNGTLAYDAYGIAATKNNSVAGAFGYTGQVYFPTLGLNYYKARFYHPRLGRFLQTDPIGYKDDMDLYSYVGNDPVNKTDPTGMYGRGEGWTEKQWKQFDRAQKAAAGKMESKATSLEKQAAKLDKKGKEGGDDLRTAASNLREGAKALRSDGSDGKLAYAGSSSAMTWTRGSNVVAFVNGAGGNIMVVNLGHDVFKAGGKDLAKEVTHESLHTAGLSDWTRGQRAYCCAGQEYLDHYNTLTPDEKVNNPDYLKLLVW